MKQTLLIGLAAIAGLVFWTAEPAAAQTEFLTRKQQKREVRNSLREAKLVDSDYTESHLNLKAYNYEPGESGRKLKKRKKKDAMPINPDGTAVIKTKLFQKKTAHQKARTAQERARKH